MCLFLYDRVVGNRNEHYSAPVHANTAFRLDIQMDHDSVLGRAMNRRHEPSWTVSANRDHGQIKGSNAFTNLLESRTARHIVLIRAFGYVSVSSISMKSEKIWLLGPGCSFPPPLCSSSWFHKLLNWFSWSFSFHSYPPKNTLTLLSALVFGTDCTTHDAHRVL